MRWRIDSKCLSMSKVQAEMSSSRRPSAFSFETFATSSFDVVMAEEGIQAEAEAITHAASQVAVRLRLVHEMNCEVRRDSEAALREADVSFGKGPASRARGAAAPAEASEGAPRLGDEPDESTSRAMEQRFSRALEEVSRRWEKDDGSPGIKLDVGPLLQTTGAGARPGARKARAAARSKAHSWEASAAQLGAEGRDGTGLDRWEAICTRALDTPTGGMPELEWLSLLPQPSDPMPTYQQADAYSWPEYGDAEMMQDSGLTGWERPDDNDDDDLCSDQPGAAALHIDPACRASPEAESHDHPHTASQRSSHPAHSQRSPSAAASDDNEVQPMLMRRSKVRSRRRVVDCSSSDDDFEPAPRPAASRGARAPSSSDAPACTAEEDRHASPAELPERGPVHDAPLLVPIREPFAANAAPTGGGAGSSAKRSFLRKTIGANLEPLPDERAPSRRDESFEGLVLDQKLGWKFVLPPEATNIKLGAAMFEPMLSKGAHWRSARGASVGKEAAGAPLEAWKSSIPEDCRVDDAGQDGLLIDDDEDQGEGGPAGVPASSPLPGGADLAADDWLPYAGGDALTSAPTTHFMGPAEVGRPISRRPPSTAIQGRLERRTPMPSVPQLGQRIAARVCACSGDGADSQLSALARNESVSGGSTPARVFLGLLWAATTQHSLACQQRAGSSAVAESPFPSGASVHLSVSDRDAEGRSIDVRVVMQQ